MTKEHKEAFLAEAARIYDEMVRWNEENTEGSVEELESFLREKRLALTRHLLRDALELRTQKQSLDSPTCPSCGLKMTYEETRARSIETLEGGVKIKRPYYSCRACGEWIYPLDKSLGLSRSSWSGGIQKGITALGVSLPFQKAAEVFGDLTGVWISSPTAYRITQGKGERLRSEQEKEAEEVWPQGKKESRGGQKRGIIQPSPSR